MSRLLVEGLAHERVCMMTLTYRPADLPAGETLVPDDVRLALMRLRINFRRGCARDPLFASLSDAELYERTRLRFFVVGEYGGRFGRPHYHAICFGADASTSVNGVPFSRVLRDAWSKGSVHVGGGWSGKTAAYVSGYVVKGHNVRGLDLLEGRHPEFSRWPTRPGLGVPGVRLILPQLLGGRDARELIAQCGDLPSMVRVAERDCVLGGYLMAQARLEAGLTPDECRELRERAMRERSRSAHGVYLASVLADAVSAGDVELADFVSSILEDL